MQYELFTTYIDQNYATLSCEWTNTLNAQAPEVNFFFLHFHNKITPYTIPCTIISIIIIIVHGIILFNIVQVQKYFFYVKSIYKNIFRYLCINAIYILILIYI